MKKISILLFTLIFIAFSCKKSNVLLINNDDLAGSWLLKEYSGGLAYRVIIPTDSIAILFEKSGKYMLRTNHAVTAKGDFGLTKSTDGLYGSPAIINLLANDGNRISYGILLKSDSLFLSDGCCDRFSYIYLKQE